MSVFMCTYAIVSESYMKCAAARQMCILFCPLLDVRFYVLNRKSSRMEQLKEWLKMATRAWLLRTFESELIYATGMWTQTCIHSHERTLYVLFAQGASESYWETLLAVWMCLGFLNSRTRIDFADCMSGFAGYPSMRAACHFVGSFCCKRKALSRDIRSCGCFQFELRLFYQHVLRNDHILRF